MSVDPITANYPWYTPYQFAGNMPIGAIDLDGLEPAVIVGSERQVKYVNQFNQNIKKDKQNWIAFNFENLKQAKTAIQNHKALGNKVTTVLLQAHGNSGNMAIFAGEDNKVTTTAVEVGGRYVTDDEPISAYQIRDIYIPELKRVSEIKDKKLRESELADLKQNNSIVKNIDEFLGVVNEIEDGGTIILNGCHVFDGKDGLELSDTIMGLTNKRIHIVGPQDYTSDISPNVSLKDRIFSGGFVPKKYQSNGYMLDSKSTKKDLKLNATGKETYNLVPLSKDNPKP